MRMFTLCLVAAAAPLLSSCQSGGAPAVSRIQAIPAKKASVHTEASRSTGLAGTTGQAGYAGTASETYAAGTANSPFAPGPLRPSARFVPPDHYWGFGGGYSRGGSLERANDNLNFFRENIYCRRYCGYGRSYGSCYSSSYGNCYPSSYSYSSCYSPSRFRWR
jgi:hypothetical protein